MPEAIACLTYPDVIRHLDATSEDHICSCPKCCMVLQTMEALIQDATPEESTLLDQIESRFTPSFSMIFMRVRQ
jgi:hypothetical protein